MADFCAQCAEEMGFSSDLVPQNGIPGYYYPSLCEGCGHIMVNSRGECVSKDCLVPDHAAPPDKDLVFQCDTIIPLPEGDSEFELIESNVVLEEPITQLIFESFDDVTILPGYKYYLIQPNGTYAVYIVKE